MDKLEEIELKKERKIVTDSWYNQRNWLINYISKPIR